MKFAEYPFVRYLLFFIAGLLLFDSVPLSNTFIVAGLLVGYCCFLILVLLNRFRKRYDFATLIPLLGYFQIFFLGVWISYQQTTNVSNAAQIEVDKIKGYTAVVIDQEEVKQNSKLNRVRTKEIFFTDSVKSISVEVLLYHRMEEKLSPGDLIWVSQKFQPIEAPLNPNEFHYQRFLCRQGIYFRQFISEPVFSIGKLNENPIELFFQSIRVNVQKAFQNHMSDDKARQIALALLLGQKKDLDKEISDAYATAGAMHILAVSGLHVGIIYGFFFFIFKPYRLSTRMRVFYLSLIIVLIWCYAMLTGMSPSVMRSATMFTFVSLAQMKSRSPSIFNPLGISALLLLLFDSNLLYSVGFQLSYLALLGILLVQPLIVKLWVPSSRLVEYVWQITTVGISAQLATFPLSAMYFGIFPTYFMLSNLVAIPGAFLIMSIGVPFMLFSPIPQISGWLGWLTEQLIRLLNFLVFTLQQLPKARLEVDWDLMLTWVYLAVLVVVLAIVYQPQKIKMMVLLSLMFSYLLFRIFDVFSVQKNQMIIVSYDLNMGEAWDVFEKGRCFSWENTSRDEISFKINPFRKNMGIKESLPLEIVSCEGLSYILLPNKKLVHLDSLRFLADETWRFDGLKWTRLSIDQDEFGEKGARKYIFKSQAIISR